MQKADFQLRARFRHACKLARIPDGATLLVAVSGGADSVALFRLCHAEAAGRGWRVCIGHVDHGLHPASAEHARWVRGLAREHGAPSLGVRVSASYWRRRRGDSIEAAARTIRRRALRRMARRIGARSILLGHTRDDQAETLLLQLLRGSGVRGLAGMALRNGPWLRPLLQVSRSHLRDALVRQDVPWREDPTNQDPRFLRNRVRQRLIPLLEGDLRPGAIAVLARTAETLSRVRGFLERAGETAWNELSPEVGPSWIRLDRTRLGSYDRAVIEEVLRCAYRAVRGSTRGLHNAHVRVLADAVPLARPQNFDLPAGVRAILDRDAVRLERPASRSPSR